MYIYIYVSGRKDTASDKGIYIYICRVPGGEVATKGGIMAGHLTRKNPLLCFHSHIWRMEDTVREGTSFYPLSF